MEITPLSGYILVQKYRHQYLKCVHSLQFYVCVYVGMSVCRVKEPRKGPWEKVAKKLQEEDLKT